MPRSPATTESETHRTSRESCSDCLRFPRAVRDAIRQWHAAGFSLLYMRVRCSDGAREYCHQVTAAERARATEAD